jgi:sodium/potassium-transporting ATPase subunit alpha
MLHRLASGAAGLSPGEATERLRHDGPNALPEPSRPAAFVQVARLLVHRFALLLWAGAALAAVGDRFRPGEGMLLIAGALVFVVLVNALFSFWQERRAERAMAAFRGMLSPRARVLRDGVEIEMDAADLVVGDVVVLREGDGVPADARLIATTGLKVDNSSLTGESEPQLRTVGTSQAALLDSRNLVFSGTLVTSGTGRAVVFATGGATQIGRIARVTHETRRIESPISRELRHFIRTISAIAVALGLLFFAIGTLVGNDPWTNLVFAIGIIVANVPEGLLPTVTLGLAIAGRKMARRNALLRSLESAETLGCTTIIGTDKTGTLTSNEMRVSDLLLGASARDARGEPATSEALAWSLRVMALCNNATLVRDQRGVRSTGDPTDQALLLHAHGIAGDEVDRLRAACPRLFEQPFESAARVMTTVNQVDGEPWALLKGAPEVVLARCTRSPDQMGGASLDQAARARANARADALARQGRRVLALARKRLAPGDDPEEASAAGGYDYLGLVAMYDPPRPEVAQAIARCRAAGIRIIVISGDHPLTVEAIAREVGIATSAEPRTYTGHDLAGLGRAALRRLLAHDEVLFARTSPLDKLRIVEALQEMGHVVAVTGDGVNDAPALKRADIGIAMGRSGTEVARAAADMVLMDDDFSTIVAAVEEGRVLYGNIRRFIGYVLTSNVPEILPYVAFVLFGIPLPLPVLLILAIDLGTDMVPAIGLATETAENDVMRQPPRRREDRLLSGNLLLRSYGLWGWLETAAGFAAYFLVLFAGGWSPGQSLAASDPLYGQAIAAFFGSIVLCQVANVLVWRTTHESALTRELLRNRTVLAGIAIEVAIVAFIVHAPPGHELFGTHPVAPVLWLAPALIALVMLGVSELLKASARARGRRETPMSRAPRAATGTRNA